MYKLSIMKKFIFLFFVLSLFVPALARAQEPAANVFFRGRVGTVLDERAVTTPEGDRTFQQDLNIIGLNGDYKGRTIEIREVGDLNTSDRNRYRAGDKVVVMVSRDDAGGERFIAADYDRAGSLFWLFGLFTLAIVAVGRWKGVRSVLSLALTFLIMIKYIVPQILDGSDPVVVTIIGSFAILLTIIYLTEGFNREAHISVVSIFLSLVITVALSGLFVSLAKLSGLASEEASFIVGLGAAKINLQGLLLAGIIIGALGVLDDVVISQVVAVNEINGADPGQSKKEVFRKALKVGIAHISSMTNTLFLAYAGASLPLLILFLSGQSAFADWSLALNNEILATEIVRTLAGSVGLILAVPIANLVAVWWIKKR